MLDLKKEAIKAGLGVGYTILLIWTIRHFKLSFWAIYGLLICTYIGWGIYKKDISLKGMFFSALILLGMMYLMRFLAPFGWWGYVISILLICTLIIWRRGKQWLEVKYHIETMIWGKPLKDYVSEGMKPPKIKLVKNKGDE